MKLIDALKNIVDKAKAIRPIKSLAGSQTERGRVRGLWEHTLHAPVATTDAEKLSHLVTPYGLYQPTIRRLQSGIVDYKSVKRWIASMFRVGDRQGLKDLERLLFGGGVKWTEGYENLVVNEGLNHLLDVTLSGGAQDTSWFVGLLAASPTPLAAWTATELASNDFVAYDEASLPAWTDGGVSSQSVTNSASTADFTISTNSSSIGGAFLIGTNTKGTPAGTVYAAGAFTGGNKAADDGDTLSVTATFTSAAA